MSALPRRHVNRAPLVIAGAIAAAYAATRLALLWRFQWFVDETTFASFAKQVHGDIGQFFIAEGDKKGLLASWLGAGLIAAGIESGDGDAAARGRGARARRRLRRR